MIGRLGTIAWLLLVTGGGPTEDKPTVTFAPPAEPNAEPSRFAPRVERTAIMPEAIGALVGARGANIKGITEATGARVTVEDTGEVLVYDSFTAPPGFPDLGSLAVTVSQDLNDHLRAGHILTRQRMADCGQFFACMCHDKSKCRTTHDALQ